MKKWLACLLVIATSGCPDVKTDPGEGSGELANGPTVEFDPANAILPFPNNLVLNPATGKVTIPAPACETPAAKAVREGVLDTLDGFGTFETAMQVTFTDDIDMSTLDDTTVVMYERSKQGMAASTPVPIALIPGTALRFNKDDCTAAPAQIHALTIVPKVPLDEHSTYTIALLSGIKTTAGADYQPSFTWALVRQTKDPVTLADGCDYSNPASCTVVSEQTPLTPGGDANGNGIDDLVELVGLDQLWKAHAAALAFLDPMIGGDRTKVLVAWEITTMTTTDPLDPTVTGSPAAMVNTTVGLLGVQSLVTANGLGNATQLIEGFLLKAGLAQDAQGAQAICQQIGCDNVGDVLVGGVAVPTYQTHVQNPYDGMADIPGPWTDPFHPAAQEGFVNPETGMAGVQSFIAFIPKTAVAAGWPTVEFGHGLGSQKESLFVFGPQLASAGFASIAIDFVDHGSRAVRITADASLGCAGTCKAAPATSCGHDSDCGGTDTCVLPAFGSSTTQCFAPFLSTDLATTRDNIRDTILDLQRLSHALKACGTTNCGALKVDPAHVEYTGISLGGIIGSTTTATDQDIKTAVLNVPGMGWVDIFENTANLTIRCGVVDGLIMAGILQGDLWNGNSDPAMATGLCATDAWKQSPAYQQFSGIARWVLDPADGANFASMLAPRRFLIQEVVNDEVVPNFATNDEGMLVGLTPQTADPYAPTNPGVPSGASAAILTNLMSNKWLQYPTLPASDVATGGFGNAFQHASLLSPVSPLVAPGHCSNDPTTACVLSSTCGGNNVCVYPGTLGTARVQTDAITYLLGNK